ncbi:MAG: zinc ribbon domain-containing protein [Planctomycetota bacterium]
MKTTSPHAGSEVLRSLHRIHRQLTDLRERLDRGPKRVKAAETYIAHCEKALADTQAELKRLKVVADQKQLQFKSGEQKIKDLKAKLNAAQSNREYQALKDQIAADQMANSVMEDEVYEALVQIDTHQPKVGEEQQNLKAAQEKAAAVRKEVEAELPTIRGDIDRLEAELKVAEATLPEDIAELYQRGVRQKGEDALAAVEGSVCGGCSQVIPVNVISQVMLGKPIFCKVCGRLLYMPEKAG